MPRLFDRFSLKGVTLRNRIGVSPMCQYSSREGIANSWHFIHLGSRAVGGAGLVMAEATAVEPRGRISPQDAGLWGDEHVQPLKEINRFIVEQGAVPGIQLAHAGRKGSAARPWEGDHSLDADEGGWETIGPSPVAFGGKLVKVPREMNREDIRAVTNSFRAASLRALEAGYEWLELHAAHGYLCHSFHSPLSNYRTDEYGGRFDNRIRFTLETVETIRSVWPDKYPLAVRLSCTDWVEGGWTLDESIELSKRLRENGVDLIDCSSGFGSPDHHSYPFGPGWQVPFAERIRREAGIATAAVGVITEPTQADEIVGSGKADIVLLARRILKDPYWPYRAAQALGMEERLPPPSQYLRWM